MARPSAHGGQKGHIFVSQQLSTGPIPASEDKKSTPVVPHVELVRTLVPGVAGGDMRVVQTIPSDFRARGGVGAKAERA